MTSNQKQALGHQNSSNLAAMINRALADRNVGGDKTPPVEMWNPAYCGALDLVIKQDGTWFYQGTPITRERLVRLFASVLRKDDDGITYLVTPVEKLSIEVEDTPFIAVEMDVSDRSGDQILTFRTNMGDVVEIGPEHGLRFDVSGPNGALKPYIHVRGRLEARVNRAVMYELMTLGEVIHEGGQDVFALRSAGKVFPVMEMDTLNKIMDEDT